MPLTERSTILAFKAGRALRRDDTNIVEPRADKGAVVIDRGDDEELHFMWKNRETEATEEVRSSHFRRVPRLMMPQDLILIPSDASFVSVSQASGRVYVLKFSSSNQRHFVSTPPTRVLEKYVMLNDMSSFGCR